MLPLILAGAGLLAQGAGQAAAGAATLEGARQQTRINQQAIDERRGVQDDLTARNKPYYDAGISQLPQVLAMSANPNFSASDAKYGDKYSLGAKQMLLSSLARQSRNLAPMGEVNSGFDATEGGRLLNRRLDMLKVGYGQAGTAGQSLMSTGSAIADIGQRIGNTQANAMSLANLGRQNFMNNAANDASNIPLYLHYKHLNETGDNRRVNANGEII